MSKAGLMVLIPLGAIGMFLIFVISSGDLSSIFISDMELFKSNVEMGSNIERYLVNMGQNGNLVSTDFIIDVSCT